MSLVTEIRWREYPKRKPVTGGNYPVIVNGRVTARNWYAGYWYDKAGENQLTNKAAAVTAFALPEDISTKETT